MNTKGRAHRLAVLGGAVLSVFGLAVGGGAMVASATELSETVSPTYSASADAHVTFYGSGDHCAADMTTDVVVCAASRDALPSALKAVTGKTVDFGTTAAIGPVAPAATFVLGTIFSYPNYGGSSLDMIGTGTTCTPGTSWGFSNLGAYGWDNDIDSFKSWGSCRTTLYENNNYGGSAYGPYWDKTSIGVMQNQASSIVYKG